MVITAKEYKGNPRQRFEYIDDPDRIACQMPQPPVQDIVKHHRKQCGEPHVDYVFNIGVFAQRENYQRDQRQRDRVGPTTSAKQMS